MEPFHDKEEDYFKLGRAGIFLSNNYIEYESSSDRNKTLSVEQRVNKIRPCLKDIKYGIKIMIRGKCSQP